MATLVVTLGNREIQKFPITKTLTLIGRDQACDLVLDNPVISRRHARLVATPDGFRLDNLSQTGGITVNDEVIRFTSMKPGDRIGLGKFTLRFIVEGGRPYEQLELVQTPDTGEIMTPGETVQLDPDYMQKVRSRLNTDIPDLSAGGGGSRNKGNIVTVAVVTALLVGLLILLLR